METQQLKNHLISNTSYLYCVLDGASVPELPMRLYETNTPHYCVMKGELPPDTLYMAPFLAILFDGSPFAEWVFSESAAKHWGIFFHSRHSIKEMRRHTRELFSVLDESGRPMMFRYYDPRVIRKFLPTCNPAELKEFFGKVDAYFAETEDGSGLTRYTVDGDGKLVTTDLN